VIHPKPPPIELRWSREKKSHILTFLVDSLFGLFPIAYILFKKSVSHPERRAVPAFATTSRHDIGHHHHHLRDLVAAICPHCSPPLPPNPSFERGVGVQTDDSIFPCADRNQTTGYYQRLLAISNTSSRPTSHSNFPEADCQTP